jgi:hypothetical protein
MGQAPKGGSDGAWRVLLFRPTRRLCKRNGESVDGPVQPAQTKLHIFQPPSGERFQADWVHIGTLDYQRDKRKLYAYRPGRSAQPHALSGVHSRPILFKP